MKKLLVSAIAVMLTGSVFAQKAEDLKNNWEMTIPVKNAQSTTLDKLFTAWADVNPGDFVNIYKKYKKAPAENIDGYQVNYKPKNGYMKILEEVQFDNILETCFWNLPNGNKLLGIYITQCHECGNCGEDEDAECHNVLMFYEYETAKNRLSPRADITKKVMDQVGKGYPSLPCEGRDIEYYDLKSGNYKKVKWNGNGF